ncbi:MAG: DUF7000 family protein [Solirubrobacterales bacterium]
MESMNDYINEYTKQLSKGQIQKAYKGIITFMSGLKNYMENKYPEYTSSSLYFGYMDMTYFAFTPLKLKKKNLKIAVVYLHEQNRFDVWLAGGNKGIQAEYIEKMKYIDIGNYKLSRINPGVDSIIELQIIEHPNFDQVEDLMKKVEIKTIEFTKNILLILNE